MDTNNIEEDSKDGVTIPKSTSTFSGFDRILSAFNSLRPSVLLVFGVPLAGYLFIELLIRGSDSRGEGPIALILLVAFLLYVWMTAMIIFVLCNMIKDALLFIIKYIENKEGDSTDRIYGIINIFLILSFFVGFLLWSALSLSGRFKYLFVGGIMVIFVRYIVQLARLMIR